MSMGDCCRWVTTGLSESAATPFANWAAQVTMWYDHGQPLAKESFPNARILAGEVLSPAQTMEIIQRDRQGERVCLSVTGGPLRDPQGHIVGAVTICRDITERNQVERTLRQQTLQLQLQAELIDRAHDAILVRDPYSRNRSWNRGAQHLYGWTVQEALGRVTHELLQTRFPVSLADVEAHLEREGQWEGALHKSTSWKGTLRGGFWHGTASQAPGEASGDVSYPAPPQARSPRITARWSR